MIKKCPKCGGEMKIGYLTNAPHWINGTSMIAFKRGKRIFGYKCTNCNYVEFYVENPREKKMISTSEDSRKALR